MYKTELYLAHYTMSPSSFVHHVRPSHACCRKRFSHINQRRGLSNTFPQMLYKPPGPSSFQSALSTGPAMLSRHQLGCSMPAGRQAVRQSGKRFQEVFGCKATIIFPDRFSPQVQNSLFQYKSRHCQQL